MDVQLNFINQSNDQNNSQVVIFQKNLASKENQLHVAWRVIENCGPDDTHPFTYPQAMQLSVSDRYGTSTPRLDVGPGRKFTVSNSDSGLTLAPTGSADKPTEVQVVNALAEGTIDANVYKDGLLLATRTSIAPRQTAAFEFEPTLWIGTAQKVKQGAVITPAMVDQINTQISLAGITRANLIMTGGGQGIPAPPLTFTLQGVVPAATGSNSAGASPPAGHAAAAPPTGRNSAASPAQRSNPLRALWKRLVGGRST